VGEEALPVPPGEDLMVIIVFSDPLKKPLLNSYCPPVENTEYSQSEGFLQSRIKKRIISDLWGENAE
jgi:hypothetical protein